MKEDELGRACSTHGGRRYAYMVLVGKQCRCRWEDNVGNVELDIREIGCEFMDWILLGRVGTNDGLL
jgi:hypothetical protein